MPHFYAQYIAKISIPPNTLRYGTAVLALIVTGCFFTIAIGNAVHRPLCCADDSYISTAAKNFANGFGYSVSFESPDNKLVLFEPAITTGPTLVLPAALLIRLIGNKYWAPGVAAILMNILIFTFLYFFSVKIFGFIQANIFISLLIISFYFFAAPSWFLLWFVLLGEATGAILFILGLLLFSFFRENKKYLYASMFIFGLSLMTKLIYAIILFPVLFFLLIDLFGAKIFSRKNITTFSISIFMLVLPHLLWEMYKLGSLGLIEYVNSLRLMANRYIAIHGESPKFNLLALFTERKALVQNQLGTNLTYIIVSIPCLLSIVWVSELTKEQKLFSYLSILGIIPALLWWILLSKGWARYGMPWLFLFFTLFPFLIVVVRKNSLRLLLFASLVFILNVSKKDTNPIKTLINSKFTYGQQAKNLQSLAVFLNSQNKEKIFVSGWWGGYSDIEYALPGTNNFKEFNKLEGNEEPRKMLLIRNTTRVNLVAAEEFHKFAKSFTDTVFYKSPYLVTTYSGPKE